MTDKQVWFITGAGRGMGVDFAKAALAAGNAVVATGARPRGVTKAVGEATTSSRSSSTSPAPRTPRPRSQAAVERFGRIDVLVNNAGNFYAGFFEELTPEQMDRQLTTTLIGPMNVTRAVLPVMRRQRSGHVITISSSAGLAGFEFGTAYAASKFGVEGWMESLRPEVAPFGIDTTIVNPGFFRTELLTPRVDELRRDRRSTTTPSAGGAGRRLDRPERPAVGRPGQARPGARDDRQRAAAAAALHRRCRRDRVHRAEGRRSAGRHRPQPRAVRVARPGVLTMTRARPVRTMRAAIMDAPGEIRVGDRPYPVIVEPTDAIVRIVLTCVCGGDLWQYSGESPFEPGPIGHEFVGVVEGVGTAVRGLATGDLVIAPTAYCDGTCPNCQAGIANACTSGGFWAVGGIDGGQGEAVRVPFADATLVRVPGSGHSEATMRSLLALSDVMGTGHHAALSAGVRPGSVVAVIGDGAVGLCAISAAQRLGAARFLALSRNPARQALAREFGATDVVPDRGDAAAAAVLGRLMASASTPPSSASGPPRRSRRRWP